MPSLLLIVPRCFTRLLGLRAPPQRGVDASSGEIALQDEEVLGVVRRCQRNLFLAFVGLAIVWPVTVFFPLLFAFPLIRNILRLRRTGRADSWTTVFNQGCYVGLGIVQLTTFFLGNLIPAVIALVLFELGSSVALSRAPQEAIGAQGAG